MLKFTEQSVLPYLVITGKEFPLTGNFSRTSATDDVHLFYKSSMLTDWMLKLKHLGFLQQSFCPFLSLFWVSKNEEMTLKGLLFPYSEAVSSDTISQIKEISMISV